MTWTRLDDTWSERMSANEDLSHADRWHYLQMIQFCSRSGRRDGIMRGVDARRVSDHPNPPDALARLYIAGLIETMPDDKYRIVEIDSHLPSDAVIARGEAAKQRMRRKRAHDKGDHSMCDDNCSRTVLRTLGTGQDGTGRDTSTTPSTNVSTWDAVEPLKETGPACIVCGVLLDRGDIGMLCDAVEEEHMKMRTLGSSV